LCNTLWWFHVLNAHAREVRQDHTALLASTPVRVSWPRFYAVWYQGVATSSAMAEFEETAATFREARRLAVALDDDQAIALADGAYGQLFLWHARLSEAEELNERALTLARRVGARGYRAIFLFNAGWTALGLGDLTRAAELLDQSVAAARGSGSEMQLGMALPCRGIVSPSPSGHCRRASVPSRSGADFRGRPVSGNGVPTARIGQTGAA